MKIEQKTLDDFFERILQQILSNTPPIRWEVSGFEVIDEHFCDWGVTSCVELVHIDPDITDIESIEIEPDYVFFGLKSGEDEEYNYEEEENYVFNKLKNYIHQ